MVIDYLEGRLAGNTDQQILQAIRPHYDTVRAFNGYYDKHNSESNFIKYCDSLLDSYATLQQASLVGGKWLTRYFRENINQQFWDSIPDQKIRTYDHLLQLIERRVGDLTLYPFPFIEKTTSHPWSMFNVFHHVLDGKRVLAVTPFSQSIEKNFHNRSRFFKNYKYPDFELFTFTSPVTYSGLPDNLYPHDSWFESTEAMKRGISSLEFDIALLSCGSYAMPLGKYIAESLNRKAIYVGGVLQLYFGIMGRRYRNEFFTAQVNEDCFVYAEERELYMQHVSISSEAPAEGFGAYF
jgi:hypothetical protein